MITYLLVAFKLWLHLANSLISCGQNNLSLYCRFCYERFSWSKEKADELLLSVLKEYDRHEVCFVNQLTCI